MYGYVRSGRDGGGEYRQIGGMWFYCLTLPVRGAFCALRRRKLWRKMQKAGVRRAVLPRELRDEAAQWGVEAVEVFSLRRAVFGQLLDCCPPLQGKTVRLTAPYVSAAVGEAAEVLAQRARYVDLQVGRGGEELSAHLQRRYGLAVGAVGPVVLTVRFDSGVGWGKSLHLGEDCEEHESVRYHVPRLAAEGIEAEEQLLSALLMGGYVKKEEIVVKSITSNA